MLSSFFALQKRKPDGSRQNIIGGVRRGAGKAIIALARKFLGIIYRTLKNKWVFEDFTNFTLAEAA